MKRLLFMILTFTAFALFTACSGGNEPATEQQAKTEKAVTPDPTEFTWYKDWDAGMAAAKKENKPVIVDFYADWCKFCIKMDKETFTAPEIKKRLSNDWIAIKIDTEDNSKTATFDGKTMNHQELVRHFGVTGFPTYHFIDKTSKPIYPYPGYVPKETFGYILDYFRDEIYTKNIKINDYINSKS